MGSVLAGEGDRCIDAACPMPWVTDGDGQGPAVILLHHGVKFPSGSSYGSFCHTNQIGVCLVLKMERDPVPTCDIGNCRDSLTKRSDNTETLTSIVITSLLVQSVMLTVSLLTSFLKGSSISEIARTINRNLRITELQNC